MIFLAHIMGFMMSNQKGFTVFEIIVVVLLLAILGTAAYVAIGKHQSAAKNTSASATKSTVSTSPSVVAAAKPPTNCVQAVANAPFGANDVYVTLADNGPDPSCLKVPKGMGVLIDNQLSSSVTVTAGTSTYHSPAKSGFNLAAGRAGATDSSKDGVELYLKDGQNIINVSTYSAQKYPVIWVY
jgi:prepilin-type N-terminal cleavage/methylation domain-containing protein